MHLVTKETITNYKQLIQDPLLTETWSKVTRKELERLVKDTPRWRGPTRRDVWATKHQEYPKGQNSDIRKNCGRLQTPETRSQQSKTPTGGNLIQCPGELNTKASDLRTSKICVIAPLVQEM